MEFNFCRRCGTKLQTSNNHVFTCMNAHTLFANAAPTVGVFLLTENDELILGVRGREPHIGKLDTIGGFVDDNENIENALKREILEEIGLSSDSYTNPTYLTSAIDLYNFNGENIPVVSSFFWARLTAASKLTPQDDVSDIVIRPLQSFHVDEIGGKDVKDGLVALQKLHNENQLIPTPDIMRA